MPESIAKAGDYELTVGKWRQQKAFKDGQATDWVDYVRGDIVTLDAADAERLLRAGAVKPTTKAQAQSAAAQAPDATQALIDAHPEVTPTPAPSEGEAAPVATGK